MKEYSLISICIPAYKRVEFLQRLFDSILIQTFKNYEVIVTDDSPDDSVQLFIENYSGLPNVHYFKNSKTLGTPENWNQAIRNANGKWIKLMHDDDWFAHENSLRLFYEATKKNEEYLFFFSAHNNVDGIKNLKTPVYLSSWGNFLLHQSALNLFKKNYIGNPSCTLIRKEINLFYDNKFKWIVDFEYYIRCLIKVKKCHYINKILVNVGINDTQVTNYTFKVAEVEIPENHILLEKMGFYILRNIFVYDYYWRLYRNLEIRSEADIQKFYNKPLHPLLKQMINFQRKFPYAILRNGIFSKTLMIMSYCLNMFSRKNDLS